MKRDEYYIKVCQTRWLQRRVYNWRLMRGERLLAESGDYRRLSYVKKVAHEVAEVFGLPVEYGRGIK